MATSASCSMSDALNDLPIEDSPQILSEFKIFSDLPSELRLKIWKFAAEEPRIIETRTAISPYSIFAGAINPIPALLHTNAEAREEALKRYTLLKMDAFGEYSDRILRTDGCVIIRPFRTYISFERDTLCLTVENREDYPSSFMKLLRQSAYGQQIQRFALSCQFEGIMSMSYTAGENFCFSLKTMGRLQTVAIIVPEEKEAWGGRIKTLHRVDETATSEKTQIDLLVKRGQMSRVGPSATWDDPSFPILGKKTPDPELFLARAERSAIRVSF